MRDYRHLINPKQHSKGKVLLILAFHAKGKGEQAIADLTNTKVAVVRKYIDTCVKSKKTPPEMVGESLSVDGLCDMFAAVRRNNNPK